MDSGSYLLDNGVPSIVLIATTGSIVKLSHMFAQRGRIGGISSALLYFDQKLEGLDFRMRSKEVNYWVAGLVSTFFIATFCLSVAISVCGRLVFNKTNTIVLVVFINIANIPYIVLLMLFMICELCVWSRLKLLCSFVENGMRTATSTGRKDTVRHHQLVAGVTDLHHKLSTVVQHTNALFLVQVFMCFAAFTSLLIFTLFSYYRAAVILGETEYHFAWLTISWSTYNSFFVLPTILIGAWVRIEKDRFAKLVHKFLRNAADSTLQDQLLHLSQQLRHHSLGTRTSFVPVDWPAYASIIGYITTYVVILIQFDSKAMENSKSLSTTSVA